jgi:hypothetical protein
VLWNFFVRLILSQYLTFTLASAIDVAGGATFRLMSSGELTGCIMSVTLMTLSVGAPILFLGILWRMRLDLKDNQFHLKFGSLTDGLKK